MKKQNAKPRFVGADASVRPYNQKGITLIALIITIIVMLIIVGVTIGVAQSGNLFGKANRAVKQYSEAQIKERLDAAMVNYLAESATGKPINKKNLFKDIVDATGCIEDPAIEENPNSYKTSDENLEISYNENSQKLKIVYNGKMYTYERFGFAGVKDTKVEVTGEEHEIETNQYTAGRWKYSKNEDGTVNILGFVGTTAEELNNVTIPNVINGQKVNKVAYLNGLQNATGTLTFSYGLKTSNGYESFNGRITSSKIDKLVLEDNVQILGAFFFTNANVNELEIKDDVTINADTPFSGSRIKNLIIGSGCTINDLAFNAATITEKATFGDSCTIGTANSDSSIINSPIIEIGNNCTLKLSSNVVKTIKMGDNCKIKGMTAKNIENIEVGNNIELNGDNLFDGSTLLTNEVAQNLLDHTTKINAGGLFKNCTGLTKIKIANGTNIAGQFLFNGCDNLQELIIGDNCTALDHYIFRSAPMRKLIIGNNVNLNEKYYFADVCPNLNELIIGENCKLAYDTFGSGAIQKITIGKGTVGPNGRKDTVFMRCENVKTIDYYLTDSQIQTCNTDSSKITEVEDSTEMLQIIKTYGTYETTFDGTKLTLTRQQEQGT